VNRNPILFAALFFIVLLGVLTVVVTVRNGPDILTVASLLVLAMFAFGIVGALREPPQG
jgi:hypothetical protein